MKSVDLRLWERSLAVYKDIVSLLSDEKRKRKKGKVVEEDDLYNLDQWYINATPTLVYLILVLLKVSRGTTQHCNIT